ncbi:hypothetical protein OHC76_12745 [Escherichia coli]|nr:hypothetical protein [Escherichia coli]
MPVLIPVLVQVPVLVPVLVPVAFHRPPTVLPHPADQTLYRWRA